MTTQKQYEPFGDEWFLEMKKWNKTHLIDLLRTQLMENISLKSDRGRLLVAVKEAREMLLAKGVNDSGVGMAGTNMLIKEMES